MCINNTRDPLFYFIHQPSCHMTILVLMFSKLRAIVNNIQHLPDVLVFSLQFVIPGNAIS